MASSKYHKIGKHFKVVLFDLPPPSREGIMFNFRGRETEVLAPATLKYSHVHSNLNSQKTLCPTWTTEHHRSGNWTNSLIRTPWYQFCGLLLRNI